MATTTSNAARSTRGAHVGAHGRLHAVLVAAALLWSLIASIDPALAAPPGNPPVRRFSPDLDIFPQNFAIAQDNASIVYVASANGVLTFDGERWQLIKLPNGDLARSLRFDGKSRIYVGGYNVFGYIERDASGAEQFHELTPQFRELLGGEDFADIWDILVSPQGVFFRAVRHLFLFRPEGGAVQLWRHPGRFGAIATQGDDVVLQFRGEGLRRFHGNDWQSIPGTGDLKELISRLADLPDGGLLTLAADGRWREFVDGEVRDYPMPAGFPPSSLFNDSQLLRDGTIALVGGEGAVFVLDPGNHRARRIRVDTGSLSDIIAARDGGLLAIGNLAFFHLTWPAPWTTIGDTEGFGGQAHRLRRWDKRWFALGDSGVYVADANGEQDRGAAFRRLDWTDHEAWDLLPLDERSALFAESYKLKLIDGATMHTLGDHGDLYPRLLRRSRFDPSLVYVGTEFGVALLQRQGTSWELRVDRGTKATSVISMIETGPGELWFGSERDGVHRITFSADRSRIVENHRFGKNDGIAYDDVPEASVTALDDGSLIAATGAGLFRWNGTRFEAVPLNGLGALRRPGETLSFARAPNGDDWAYSANHIYHRQPQQAWRREEVGDMINGAIESIAFDGDGVALFGCMGSILRYDAAQATVPERTPSIMLRSVEEQDDDGRHQRLNLLADHDRQPQFSRDGFGIAFHFAMPELRGEHGSRYQARLLGHDDSFSEWSPATTYTYRHLAPGDYVFEARARDGLGHVSEIAPFHFSIVPPWYAAAWARVLWALLSISAIAAASFAFASVRVRRLRTVQTRLEGMVAKRTRELETANKRLEEMAHLDVLTEVANRRRLDLWLAQAWQHCRENARPMAVMIIDIDHFKTYNDCNGHLAGDELLKKIVQILSHCLRRSEDLVGRYGGDEFVAVLPGAELAFASEVAETMGRRVRESGLGTISVGVAALQPQAHESVTRLLQDADAALYESKQKGRNCVSAFKAPVAPQACPASGAVEDFAQ